MGMDHVEAQRYQGIRIRHAKRLAAEAFSRARAEKERADEPTEAELASFTCRWRHAAFCVVPYWP